MPLLVVPSRLVAVIVSAAMGKTRAAPVPPPGVGFWATSETLPEAVAGRVTCAVMLVEEL